MKPVASTRTLYQHQAAVKRAYAADARRLADRLTGMLLRAAPAPDGRIDPRNETRLLIELGGQVQRFFVGENLRTAYAEDGMPQSVYADTLQRALVSVTFAVVEAHSDYLAARLPEDLKRWLRDDSMREQEQRIPNPIRLNPLAQYDPFHTWVDPRGYRLSDRIWQLSVRARTQIDQLVADGIRTGRPSLQIARDLEAHLLPGRTSRTKRPYGTYVSADAMRLARSEISRAHAAASIAAGRGNPFVSGFDWALSAQHPRIDICDRIATVGMSGERLGDPYPAGGYVPQPVVDSHPHCLCNIRPAVTMTEAEVIASLREMLRLAQPPPLTPLDPVRYTAAMLNRTGQGGGWLSRILGAVARRSAETVAQGIGGLTR